MSFLLLLFVLISNIETPESTKNQKVYCICVTGKSLAVLAAKGDVTRARGITGSALGCWIGFSRKDTCASPQRERTGDPLLNRIKG